MAQQTLAIGDLRDQFRFLGSLSAAASLVYTGDMLSDKIEREAIFMDLQELAYRISRQQEQDLGEE